MAIVGGDEMTKHIRCRVVRSVQLAASASNATVSYENYHNTDEACLADYGAGHSDESFPRSEPSNMQTISIDPVWLGKNLDCYV
jgi:hypothetical protein